jgi:hypothetical protein
MRFLRCGDRTIAITLSPEIVNQNNSPQSTISAVTNLSFTSQEVETKNSPE